MELNLATSELIQACEREHGTSQVVLDVLERFQKLLDETEGLHESAETVDFDDLTNFLNTVDPLLYSDARLKPLLVRDSQEYVDNTLLQKGNALNTEEIIFSDEGIKTVFQVLSVFLKRLDKQRQEKSIQEIRENL